MKRYFFIIAVMAVLVAGCNQNTKTPKTTVDDVKKTEAILYNADMTINMEAIPEAVATYGRYVDDNPEAADAPEVLFRAIEVAVNTRQDAQQSINMVNRLVTDYPQFDKNPVALFMLATFVYDEQQHDLDKARETYQRIIDTYPNSPFASDASIAITQLGMTPEELVKMFEEASN